MRWVWIPMAMLGLAAIVYASLASEQAARATEVLVDGGFELWFSDTEPQEWSTVGDVAREDAISVSGNAARLTGGASVSQAVPVTPGSSYTASVKAIAVSGTVSAVLQIVFLDDGFLELTPVATTTLVLGADFAALTVSDDAPGNASWAVVKITANPLSGAGAAAVFDDASLDETSGPEDTPTPTFTPTPTSTPTRTPTPRPSSSGGGVSPLTGCIFEPSRNPAEVLANAGFEQVAEGAPCYWTKFGGDLLWDGAAGVDGTAGAVLISLSQSTKWVFQVVPVEGGAWYEAVAMVRITAGSADSWIDLLWYASADGSGTNIGASEGAALGSAGWSRLSTGPVRAPASARSVRFRLMLAGPMPSSAVFDDASLRRVEAPATSTPPPTPTPSPVATRSSTPAGAAGPEAEPVLVPSPPRTGSLLQPGPACDLCLSEVMADPAEPGRDGPFEWVEIVNQTDLPIAVEGWAIGDSVSLDVLGAAVVPPGGRLVVAGGSASFPASVPVVRVDDGVIGSGLNNAADAVRLLRPDGSLADEVRYGGDAPLPAAAGGTTLARDASGAWRTDSAPTPGEPPGEPGVLALAAADSADRAPVRAIPVEAGGARTDPAPWLVLGVLVAIGVFSAPFAWQRFRKTLVPMVRRHGG